MVQMTSIDDDANRLISLPGITESEYTSFQIEEYKRYAWYSPGATTKLELFFEVSRDLN